LSIDLATVQPGTRILVHYDDLGKEVIDNDSMKLAPSSVAGRFIQRECTFWAQTTNLYESLIVLITPPDDAKKWWVANDYPIDRYLIPSAVEKIKAAGLVIGETKCWWVADTGVIGIASDIEAQHQRPFEPGGCSCDKCGEFSPYSIANAGDKFVCYGCRTNPYRYRF